MDKQFISDLAIKFNGSLPGKSSHLMMSPSGNTDKYYTSPGNHKNAAVLVVLFYKESQLNVVFIKRSSRNKADKHSGQVSFPGGKMDHTDNSLLDCALRETHEELGLVLNHESIIGQLTPLYVYVSNFMVQPYVAFYNNDPMYTLQESEVDYVIEFPIESLLKDEIRKIKDLNIRNTVIKNVPFFDLDGETLWGATAMMTNELMQIINR